MTHHTRGRAFDISPQPEPNYPVPDPQPEPHLTEERPMSDTPVHDFEQNQFNDADYRCARCGRTTNNHPSDFEPPIPYGHLVSAPYYREARNKAFRERRDRESTRAMLDNTTPNEEEGKTETETKTYKYEVRPFGNTGQLSVWSIEQRVTMASWIPGSGGHISDWLNDIVRGLRETGLCAPEPPKPPTRDDKIDQIVTIATALNALPIPTMDGPERHQLLAKLRQLDKALDELQDFDLNQEQEGNA